VRRLGGRPTVGLQILDLPIGVRIPASQPTPLNQSLSACALLFVPTSVQFRVESWTEFHLSTPDLVPGNKMPEAHEDLILFKRHDADCEVHKTRIPVANRRFWMECACKIWIVGRTPSGDVVPRQSTGCRDIKKAQAFRLSLMQQSQPEVDRGPLLSECVEKVPELARPRVRLEDERPIWDRAQETSGILRRDQGHQPGVHHKITHRSAARRIPRHLNERRPDLERG
jgi:hypothetical protein